MELMEVAKAVLVHGAEIATIIGTSLAAYGFWRRKGR
jgi:hypothetical protein